MLLFQSKLSTTLLKASSRNVSIYSAIKSSPVLVSTNKDVYTNLALEHWLYKNVSFCKNSSGASNHKAISGQNNETRIQLKQPLVLIWTDEPCVVIGRHQNPWVETRLGLVNKLGIKLARRHSGGGCVYHDESNINISIIGHRDLFENRQANLNFLAKTLNEKYGIKCEPNKRHDLIHSETGFKISGSAAKIGRSNCYHHFTLLVDTDKEVMHNVIRQKQQDFIKTNSSLSTRSSVINLREISSTISVDQVVSDLSQAYARLYSINAKDKSSETDDASSASAQDGQTTMAELNEIKGAIEDPKWIYGMTPRFTLEQSIDLVDAGDKKTGRLTIQVNHGKFDKIDVDCDLKAGNPSGRFETLVGTDFTYKEAMVNTVKMLGLDELQTSADGQLQLPNASEQIFATLMLKMIQEAHF